MKPVRTLVVAVVAVLAAVIAAAPARACIPTAFGAERVGGGPVAPGDPVSFVFSARGERDSAYEVSAGGRSVASGTGRPNTENAGSFTMPDLGRGERTVTISLLTDDPDPENRPLTVTLTYRSAAPAAPQPAAAAPEATPGPSETTTAGSGAAPAEAAREPSGAPTPPSAGQDPSAATRAPRPQRRATPAPERRPATGRGIVGDDGRATGTERRRSSTARAGAPGRASSERRGTGVPTSSSGVTPTTPSAGRSPADETPRVSRPVAESAPGTATSRRGTEQRTPRPAGREPGPATEPRADVPSATRPVVPTPTTGGAPRLAQPRSPAIPADGDGGLSASTTLAAFGAVLLLIGIGLGARRRRRGGGAPPAEVSVTPSPSPSPSPPPTPTWAEPTFETAVQELLAEHDAEAAGLRPAPDPRVSEDEPVPA